MSGKQGEWFMIGVNGGGFLKFLMSYLYLFVFLSFFPCGKGVTVWERSLEFLKFLLIPLHSDYSAKTCETMLSVNYLRKCIQLTRISLTTDHQNDLSHYGNCVAPH